MKEKKKRNSYLQSGHREAPNFPSPNKRNAAVHQLTPQKLQTLRSTSKKQTPSASINRPHTVIHLLQHFMLSYPE